jgi:hypothetical protein
MSFLKFAWSEQAVLESFVDEPKINNDSEDARKAASQFRITVAAAKQAIANSPNPSIKKSNDFLYVRTRAIGSLEKWGPNMNGDGFPFQELQASYQTFRGKGNFLDHKSDDIRMIRGLVIDAYLNNEDQCVECLIAVDRVSHPQLARHIETGVVNSVSMGTRVGFSNCSVCANVARTEDDYCNHIKSYKGMKFGALVNNAAHKFGGWPVHEVNHELEFIELSWVSVPAFKEANVLERIASLKEAVVDNTQLSEAEKEMLAFAATFYKKEVGPQTPQQMGEGHRGKSPSTRQDLEGVPASLHGISDAAQCQDNECATDPRKVVIDPMKAIGEANMNQTKTAAGMQRIKITVEKISFRKGYNDFTSEGTVTVNEKEYPWWASSTDKAKWNVSLDQDASEIISAKGNTQIISAVEQLLSKNVNDTELIIAKISASVMVRNSYLQGSPDENLSEPIEELAQKHGEKPAYKVESLEVSLKVPVRETEKKNYDKSAKEGPAGANGKVEKITENTSKEEAENHKMLQRAYIEFLAGQQKNSKNNAQV